jgi:hypothetical protein
MVGIKFSVNQLLSNILILPARKCGIDIFFYFDYNSGHKNSCKNF